VRKIAKQAKISIPKRLTTNRKAKGASALFSPYKQMLAVLGAPRKS
jgi:hypothetical protein